MRLQALIWDLLFAQGLGQGRRRGPGGSRQHAPPPTAAPPDRDFYGILGVSRDAVDGDIKKAFRKRSRDLHPDVAPERADEFLELRDAYEVLSDPETRKKYDVLGEKGLKDAQNQPDDFFGGFGWGNMPAKETPRLSIFENIVGVTELESRRDANQINDATWASLIIRYRPTNIAKMYVPVVEYMMERDRDFFDVFAINCEVQSLQSLCRGFPEVPFHVTLQRMDVPEEKIRAVRTETSSETTDPQELREWVHANAPNDCQVIKSVSDLRRWLPVKAERAKLMLLSNDPTPLALRKACFVRRDLVDVATAVPVHLRSWLATLRTVDPAQDRKPWWREQEPTEWPEHLPALVHIVDPERGLIELLDSDPRRISNLTVNLLVFATIGAQKTQSGGPYAAAGALLRPLTKALMEKGDCAAGDSSICFLLLAGDDPNCPHVDKTARAFLEAASTRHRDDPVKFRSVSQRAEPTFTSVFDLEALFLQEAAEAAACGAAEGEAEVCSVPPATPECERLPVLVAMRPKRKRFAAAVLPEAKAEERIRQLIDSVLFGSPLSGRLEALPILA